MIYSIVFCVGALCGLLLGVCLQARAMNSVDKEFTNGQLFKTAVVCDELSALKRKNTLNKETIASVFSKYNVSEEEKRILFKNGEFE